MGDVFDLAEEEGEDPSSQDFFEFAESVNEEDSSSQLSWGETFKEYGKTALKGGIEGLTRFGAMMGPTLDRLPEQEYERQTQVLDELLPTDEGFGQKGLRRALRETPRALAFPGGSVGMAMRGLAAGYAEELADELGAPEWVQAAAGIMAYIGPDMTRKLLEQGRHKELIQHARKLGISDEAIAPLLQGETKQKWLSKLVPRRGKTARILSSTRKELGSAYKAIQKSPEAVEALPKKFGKKVLNSIQEKLESLPQSLRKAVAEDFKILQKKTLTGDSLIEFYGKVNHELGKYGDKIGILKEPIKNALKSINPALAKDFDMINNLYSKYYKIAATLKPNLMTDLIGAGEAIAFLTSAATGYYPGVVKLAGEKTGRAIAQRLLLKPRFQQLGLKTMNAIKEAKFPLALKYIKQYASSIRGIDKDIADQLENITEEDIRKLKIFQDKKDS